MESTVVTPEREKELLAKRSLLVQEYKGISQADTALFARIAVGRQIREIDQELHPPVPQKPYAPKIPWVDCEKGHLYRIDCRNFCLGVFDGVDGFIGIREKFGSRYLFTEFHYDQGAPHGTVDPLEDIGLIPDHLVPCTRIDGDENQELFDWLDAIQNQN